MITATRYHDFSYGHRVHGHESKCAHLHGHNGRVHFTCRPEVGLDKLGRVIDFSVMKLRLCAWLENEWDHKFLYWEQDKAGSSLHAWCENFARGGADDRERVMMWNSFVRVPFNPTAENMAEHLLRVVGPKQLEGTGVVLEHVRVDETRKCSANAHL